MTYTEQDVERIVLEVIRRLGLLSGQEHVPVAVRITTAAELTIGERVVTMKLIGGRLTGVTRLVVARNAVVTPSVKDELKKHEIELVRRP